MNEVLHRAGDIVFTKLDESNSDAFKQFYTQRLKDENQSLDLDYEMLEKTIDDDLTNGSVTFLACKNEQIIGSLKCLDNKVDTLKRSDMWHVDLSRITEYGGLCYMGRYGIDKKYITEPLVNQGLFLLIVVHAIRTNNYFLMTETVPKQVRSNRRLGFHPVLPGEKPYLWLEVAELCPMLNNLIHFAWTLQNENSGRMSEINQLIPDDVKEKINTLSQNRALMSLHGPALVEFIHGNAAVPC